MSFKNKYDSLKQFIWFVVDHFIEDDCTYRASALAFTSLLAIVPLMSVSLAILSSFPVFSDLSGPLQDFIFENFVPATGKIIQEYLQLFAKQVTRLSLVGVVFLFITALLVMYTIERSMNKIWRVQVPRHGVSAFLLYWAILSLTPLFLGMSFAATSYLFSIPFIKGYHAPSLLVNLIPLILSFIGFTFLYVIVPNCPVKLKHGIYGALTATLLFELAKQAFVYYLSQYNTYELLYGAFATIPMFFIWVYWVWLITLFGAEISYALSVFHQQGQGEALDGFYASLIWLKALWKAQLQGKSLTTETLLATSSRPYAFKIEALLSTLIDLKLINITENGEYLLSRDLSHIRFYDLIQQLPYRMPNLDDLSDEKSPIAQRWHDKLNDANQALTQLFAMSVEDLFKEK